MSPRLTPTPVSGLSSGVLVVSVGLAHSCAIDAARALYCWGNNDQDRVSIFVACCAPAALPSCGRDALVSTFLSLQIGKGVPSFSEPTPVRVATTSGLVSVSAVSAGQVSRLCLW